MNLWDDAAWVELSGRLLALARVNGALIDYGGALNIAALVAVLSGDFTAAAACNRGIRRHRGNHPDLRPGPWSAGARRLAGTPGRGRGLGVRRPGDEPHRPAVHRGAAREQPRSLRGGAGGRRAVLRERRSPRLPDVGAARAGRGGRPLRPRRPGRAGRRAAGRDHGNVRDGLGPGNARALAGAGQRRGVGRGRLPGGDRPARPDPTQDAPGPRAPAVRRMAPPGEAPRRRARNCGSPARCSPRWAPGRSPPGPTASWPRPASGSAGGTFSRWSS